MNRVIVFIALIIFQAASLTWGASYLLHLKNGNELRTSHYWEEGDEVKFYVYGGVAGLQKEFVTRVTTSNLNYKEDATYGENGEKGKSPPALRGPNSGGEIHTQGSGSEDKSKGKTEKTEVIDIKYYSERKATLKEKLAEALEKNRQATSRKDQEAKKATRQEMLKYSQQLHDLQDELKEKNKGSLPDWWKE
ncbi:MAG: hypothetical protein ACREOB_12985 [Thermodesulfobacteriota bacterium]